MTTNFNELMGQAGKHRFWGWMVFVLLLAPLLSSLAGCEGSRGNQGPPGEPGSEPVVLGDGLNMEIEDATIGGDLRLVVEYLLSDDEGNPVDVLDLDGAPRFGFARIDTDAMTSRTRYQSYVVITAQGQDYVLNGMSRTPALMSATQAATDSGGTTEMVEPGRFRYTFATAVPPDYDPATTHTVAAFASREDRSFIANSDLDFVPSGEPMTLTRDIVSTTSCNQCHNTLSVHGGVRREVALCQVCHTDQTIDPESGFSLDFVDMIHRIHRGEELSRQPYFVVGFRQSVHDYSEVGFPQDLRNCATCHQGGTESDFWKTNPSRTGCGSCHDEVNFETGDNHAGISQADDRGCVNCHPAEEGASFDLSVTGVHTNPYKSASNPELTLAIVDVQNMVAAGQPSIRFTISDTSGPVDIDTLDRVAIVFAGPTTDYTQLISTDNRFTIQGFGANGTLVANGIGDYTYEPDGYTIPMDAMETWSVGMEARTRDIVVRGETVVFGANNPVVHVDLTSGVLGQGNPRARRTVVSMDNCNQCHNDLREHGELRTELGYCFMCHNPWGTDEERRPGLDPMANPPETIDFKVLIHKIHRGEDLDNPYTVFGFGGTPHDYTDVLFPGDLRDCASCHVNDSHLLPGPKGLAATVFNIAGVTVPKDHSILTPTTAACTSCHDGDPVATHAELNAIVDDEFNFAESCTVCHGEGSSEAVSDVHKR